jgi:hypothetical protein
MPSAASRLVHALAVLGQALAQRRVRPGLHELDLGPAGGHERRPAHAVVAALEVVVAHDPLLELPGIEDPQDLRPVLDRAIEVVDQQADVREGTARHGIQPIDWLSGR